MSFFWLCSCALTLIDLTLVQLCGSLLAFVSSLAIIGWCELLILTTPYCVVILFAKCWSVLLRNICWSFYSLLYIVFLLVAPYCWVHLFDIMLHIFAHRIYAILVDLISISSDLLFQPCYLVVVYVLHVLYLCVSSCVCL